MTESEWLASTDPEAMLRYLTTHYRHRVSAGKYAASNRSLRLFACACCWGVSAELGQDAERLVEWNKHPANNPAGWAMAWAGDQNKPTSAERVALLRDVIGNPWQPVAVAHAVPLATGLYREPWLTPTVVSLAHAAYDERLTRWETCSQCEGESVGKMLGCRTCGGRGRVQVDSGTLDPVRFGILADALLDTGCTEEGILSHLHSPGPHVRGCWVIDLLLGHN